MRVNVYAEEMTNRLQIISKEIEGQTFTGLRFYLELPATVNGVQHQAPFMHRPGDDDSSAVTFWGKRDLRKMLRQAVEMLDAHYGVPQTVSAADWRDDAFEKSAQAVEAHFGEDAAACAGDIRQMKRA